MVLILGREGPILRGQGTLLSAQLAELCLQGPQLIFPFLNYTQGIAVMLVCRDELFHGRPLLCDQPSDQFACFPGLLLGILHEKHTPFACRPIAQKSSGRSPSANFHRIAAIVRSAALPSPYGFTALAMPL